MRRVIKCAAVVVMLALVGCSAGGDTANDLCIVPNVIGMDHDAAHAAIDCNFTPGCIPGCNLGGDWHVYYQCPKAGARYTCEQVVELYYK